MRNMCEALEIIGLTDTGRVRDHNEDALFYDTTLGIVVLADGMGGYNAGEVASGLAVHAVSETLHAELDAIAPHVKSLNPLRSVAYEMLEIAIALANTIVFNKARNDPKCAGMGTTLVCALFYDNRLVVGHVGDSRLYRLRGSEFVQLTMDHSLLQEQINAGLIRQEDARHATRRNVVTRAIGIGSVVKADLQEFMAFPGDVYLFCSDGLTEMVDDQTISEILSIFPGNLPMAIQALMDQANANGGRDNISIILVRIRRDYAVQTGWISRLTAKFR